MKRTTYVFLTILLSSICSFGAEVSGRVRIAGRSQQANVVTLVYAEPLDGGRVQPGTFTLTQRNKTFLPRVLAVPAGSTVQFPNDDQIFHNVFSLSRPNPFDLGLYRAGSTKTRVFTTPTVYRIFCNIHPQMTAVVLVLPTSYYTEVDAAGNYRLDLPNGRYRITAWSERAQPSVAEITAGTNPSTVGDLSLDESRFVEAGHKNKFGQDYAAMAYDPLRDRKPR
jgi:plastocyanin